MSFIIGTTPVGADFFHVAYVKNGDVHQVWLNGELELTLTSPHDVIPRALAAYCSIIADVNSSTVPVPAPLSGIKAWTGALSKVQIGVELHSTQRAALQTGLFCEVHAASSTDLMDRSNQGRDWSISGRYPGTLASVAGPRGSFPPFDRSPVDWARETTAICPLAGGVIGQSVPISLVKDLPSLTTTFTIMGWFKCPSLAPTTVMPCFRIANDDCVGGSPEISIAVTQAGTLMLTVGSAPAIVIAPIATVVAPVPSVVHLSPTVQGGALFTPVNYRWQQIAGPSGNAAIASPTALATDVTFAAALAGTYVFELTVHGYFDAQAFDLVGATWVIQEQFAVVLPAAVAPTISSGSVHVIIADSNTVNLAPLIVDDGWSGALTYAWSQSVGPGVATIVSPTAAATNITVPDTPGIYVFKLTVTAGSFTGYGYWRVVVLATANFVTPESPADVTMTLNGVPYGMQLDTTGVTEGQNGQPDTCQFVIFQPPSMPVFSEVILTQNAKRIFAGVIISTVQSFAELPQNTFYTVNLIGNQWFFNRRRITKRYSNMSATAIALDLIGRVPGFTTTLVAPNLPVVTDLSLFNQTIADSLTALVSLFNGVWRPTYNRDVLVGPFITDGNDPTMLTLDHPSASNLKITRDGSQQYNQAVFEGGGGNAVGIIAVGVGEIEVSSLNFYSTSGGKVRADAQILGYSGVTTRLGNNPATTPTGNATPSTTDPPSYPNPTNDNGWSYTYIVNPNGALKTPVYSYRAITPTGSYFVGGSSTSGPFTDDVQFIAPASFPGLGTGIAIYRRSGVDNQDHLIVTLTSPNQIFIDKASDAAIVSGQVMPSSYYVDAGTGTTVTGSTSASASADMTPHYFLTGVSGVTTAIPSGTPVNVVILIDDVAAQAAVAAVTLDDGVITGFVNNNQLTGDELIIFAKAFIDQHKDTDIALEYDCRDQNSHVGYIIGAEYDPPTDLIDDFLIQQVDLKGFERGVAQNYHVKARKVHVTFETFLDSLGRAIQNTGLSQSVSQGSSSSSSAIGTGIGSTLLPTNVETSVFVSTTKISSDQLQQGNTFPIPLIASPGLNKLLYPLGLFVRSVVPSLAFANNPTGNLIYHGTTDVLTIATGMQLAAIGDNIIKVTVSNSLSDHSSVLANGVGIDFQLSSDASGGGSSRALNYLIVRVIYMILNVTI